MSLSISVSSTAKSSKSVDVFSNARLTHDI